MDCKCGCGLPIKEDKQYVSGHNLKGLIKTPEHCRHISEGQKGSWDKRQRMPLGSKNHDVHGYIRVKVLERAGEWKKEHILVMEASIGRKLLPNELVHHINGIRTDNRIGNLFLCGNKIQHALIEESCKLLVKDLFRMGIVKFNKDALRYELV